MNNEKIIYSTSSNKTVLHLLYSINTVSLSYSISTIVSEETCCNKMWKLCNSFKGQCHMVFGLKHSIWAPYEQARTVSQLFCLCKDINCTCKVQRLRACMVNDYTDMKFYFLLSPVFTCWKYWYCVCKHTKIFYFSYKPSKLNVCAHMPNSHRHS